MSIRKNFYLIAIMYLASSVLMIFANNVTLLGSNRFLWAPAVVGYSLLFYGRVYKEKQVIYAFMYGLLYCFLLQYTLWNNANSWYKKGILEDFYFLISSVVLYVVLYKYKFYNEWGKLGKIGIIFFIITGIMTIIATGINPMVVRASYSSGRFHMIGYGFLEKLGFGSYGYMTALISFFPIIIYFIKSEGKIWLTRNIWIILLIFFYFVLIRSQIFANVLVAGLIIGMSFAGAKKFKRSLFSSLLFTVIILIVPANTWASLFIDFSKYFNPHSMMYYKLNDIARFIENPDIFTSGTGTAYRMERYPMLFKAFIAQPFFGDASYNSKFTYELMVGGHLYWMSHLALWGIFGFIGYIILLKKIFTPVVNMFDTDFRFYYLLSVLSIVVMGLMKNLGGREIYIMLLIIIPGFYYLQFQDSR
ncbi:hypothetical protein ACX8XP_10800 [Calditrichota bacterium LG25]